MDESVIELILGQWLHRSAGKPGGLIVEKALTRLGTDVVQVGVQRLGYGIFLQDC